MSPLPRVPDRLRIRPANAPLRGRVDAQPSKNYAARWLWTSALRDGATRLDRLPESDDAAAMVECARALGAKIELLDEGRGGARVEGFGGRPASPAALDPGNAGAVLRFVLGAAALGGEFQFATSHRDSLGRRPNDHLLRALRQWGVDAASGPEGRLPISTYCDEAMLQASDDETSVEGSVSSQFLSSLLMAAPARGARVGRPQTIRVDGGELRSRPAVETTLEVMRERGVDVEVDGVFRSFRVAAANYGGDDFRVNGDWPGSAALLCAAAVVPGSVVEIDGLRPDAQGERRVVDVLRDAGCDVAWRGTTLRLESPPRLRAFEFNADLATDAAPVLTAVAALCEGESVFTGTANLRMKECDRVAAPLEELRKLGVESEEGIDDYRVVGNPEGFEGGLELNGWSDHRVVMMAAILGLRCRQPVVVATARHVAKSYPRFFEAMASLGAESAEA